MSGIKTLTSRCRSDERHASSDCGLGHVTHLGGIQEEETRVASEEPSDASPGKVHSTGKYDTGDVASYRLSIRMSEKKGTSETLGNTYSWTSDAVEEHDLCQCNDGGDRPNIDDAKRLDPAFLEKTLVYTSCQCYINVRVKYTYWDHRQAPSNLRAVLGVARR